MDYDGMRSVTLIQLILPDAGLESILSILQLL